MDIETARATLTLLGFYPRDLDPDMLRHPGITGHVRLDGENLYMSNAMCEELAHILGRKKIILSWITMEEFLKLWEEYHDLRSI